MRRGFGCLIVMMATLIVSVGVLVLWLLAGLLGIASLEGSLADLARPGRAGGARRRDRGPGRRDPDCARRRRAALGARRRGRPDRGRGLLGAGRGGARPRRAPAAEPRVQRDGGAARGRGRDPPPTPRRREPRAANAARGRPGQPGGAARRDLPVGRRAHPADPRRNPGPRAADRRSPDREPGRIGRPAAPPRTHWTRRAARGRRDGPSGARRPRPGSTSGSSAPRDWPRSRSIRSGSTRSSRTSSTTPIRAMPDGGSIALSAAPLPNGGLALEVTDDGPGIPDDIRDAVFERFTKSASSRGSGLGLAIARAIVEAHGGTISATPAHPGAARSRRRAEGTRIRIELPASGRHRTQAPDRRRVERARGLWSQAPNRHRSPESKWPSSMSIRS